VFYLKYRPQTIAEIDNIKIREKITQVLKSPNLPHAFLFTGEKGAGKTSAARIVAKTINCQNNSFNDKGKSLEPCNICENCIAITRGNAIDIIEMDAASNRKIDEIRDLIDNIKFAPVYTPYKVYIIDEVHMLTTEAFNALLKTLEEPPASTIFILATTEIDKLPKTIVSRCIHFDFGKADINEIVSMLKRVAKHEEIKVDDKTLAFIAKRAECSFRDATKILEEASINKTLTLDGVTSMLGLTGNSLELITLIEKKDMKAVMSYIHTYEEKGGSFRTLLQTLLEHLHQIILAKNDLPNTLDSTYSFSMQEITSLIKLLQEAYNSTRFSPIESLPLEVAIIEYFNNKKVI